MASNLANSNGFLGQQLPQPQQSNPMMAMNQGGFSGFNPFMMNPMMFNSNQNANLSASTNIAPNPAQLAFQNAFY